MNFQGISFRITEMAKAGASSVAWMLKQDTTPITAASTHAATRASTRASTGVSIRASTSGWTLPNGAKQVIDSPAVEQSNGNIDLSLDYETGLLMTSSNGTMNLPVTSNTNDISTGRLNECFISTALM